MGEVLYHNVPWQAGKLESLGLGLFMGEVRREDVIDETLTDRTEPQDERRSFDRSRLIVDVFFDGTDATGIASTKDMSAGGLYMNTQADLPEGAVLLLRIPLGGDQQVVVNAEVVYSNPGRGVGVRFHNFPAEARKALELALTER